MKLIKCISKNFKTLIRSKAASFVIILAPLFIFLLLELAFNVPEQYSLRIGVFSDSYSNTSEQIVKLFEQSSFSVEHSKSREACISNVRGGIFDTCVIFPANLSVGKPNDFVEIIVDASKNNMVFVIKEIIQHSIEAQSQEISKGLTSRIIDHLVFIETSAKEKEAESGKALEMVAMAQNKTRDAYSIITGMNLSFEQSALGLSSTKSEAKLSLIQTQNSIVKARAMIGSIENRFDELKDSVLAANLDNSSELLGLINFSRAGLKELTESVLYYSNASNATLKQLNKGLEVLETKLDGLSTQLNENALKKDEAVSIIGNTSKLADALIDEFKGFQANYKEIQNRLASVKIREPNEIIAPFGLKMISITPANSQVSLLFPQFLAVVILFISLIIPTVMVVNERRSTASIRQALIPVSNGVFLLAIFFTNLIIVLTQVFIIMVISKFLLGIALIQNPLVFIVTILLASSTFIIIGIFLGQLFYEEHNAVIAAVSLASLLLFVSGVIMPLEAMPAGFYKLNQYNPFVVTIALLRKGIFYSIPIAKQSNELFILLAYGVVFIGLTFLYAYTVKKSRPLARILHKS